MSRRASSPVLQRQRTSLFKRFGYFRSTGSNWRYEGDIRDRWIDRVCQGNGREFLKRRFFFPLRGSRTRYIL